MSAVKVASMVLRAGARVAIPLRATLPRASAAAPSVAHAAKPAAFFSRLYSSDENPATEDASEYPSSGSPLPPLLLAVKGDLKVAIRMRDTERLSALRAVIAACINAEKTPHRIRTDQLLVMLLRRMMRQAEETAAEMQKEGREDLAAKERKQRDVLAEYVARSGAKDVSEDELRATVDRAVREVRESEGSEGMSRTASGGKSILNIVMKRFRNDMLVGGVDPKELHWAVKRAIKESAPEDEKARVWANRQKLREERNLKKEKKEAKAKRKMERMAMMDQAAKHKASEIETKDQTKM